MMANGFIGPQQVIRHILILLILIIIINLDEIVEDTLDLGFISPQLHYNHGIARQHRPLENLLCVSRD